MPSQVKESGLEFHSLARLGPPHARGRRYQFSGISGHLRKAAPRAQGEEGAPFSLVGDPGGAKKVLTGNDDGLPLISTLGIQN